jgi:hypothetical protein
MQFQDRYDFLKTSISRYDGYYQLAAVKASLLLTSNAVLLAPALGERGRFQELVDGGGAGRALIVAAMLLALTSIAFAAWVLASTLTRRDAIGYHSLMFTESVADTSAEEHERGIRRMSESKVIDDLSHLAHLLAAGVAPKFRHVNHSLAALVSAIALTCAATLSG